MSDWGTTSDADLRAFGREAEDPDELARWILKALRRGELPEVGRVAELPRELVEALAAARVRVGRCAWCGGPTHAQRSGELACCCRDCFLEVGVLCFSCPRRPAAERIPPGDPSGDEGGGA